MEAECAKHALDEAGLTISDVDGIWGLTAPVPDNGSGITMCDYFDVHPKWVSDTNIGGASYLHHITEATAMIAAGHIDVALITYSQVSSSRGVRIGTGGGARPGAAFRPRREPWYTDAFHNIYGINTVASYAQVAQRHMYEFGTTSEQLAEIAVA